jgi:hypothetical protein
MNFIKKSWWKLFLAFYTLAIPVITFAQTGGNSPTGGNSGCNPADGKICNPLANSGINSIPDLIKTFLDGVLKIGIPIVALAIIYSGFLFVFARGNSEKLGKAKDSLLYTIIGAAILLGSWAIAKMISSTVLAL